jgi:large subunit ribosomal protein L10
MNREQKAAVIDEVAGQIQESEAIFAVDYRGISVSQAAELRTRLIEADATLRVVKNTLTQRAVEQVGAEALKDLLVGPTAFTFVRGDAALAAKAIATFRREAGVPEFKGGTMNGASLTIDELEAISRLPARGALDAQLVGVLASPVTGLVRGLNQLIQGLAMQLGQIAEQGLVSGEPPAAEKAPAAEEAPATEEASGDDAAAEPEPPAEEESPTAEAEAPAAEEAPAETVDEAPEEPAEEAAASADGDDVPSAEEAPAGDSGNAPTQEDPAADEAPAQEASGDTPAENDETDAPSEGDETDNRAQPAEPAASPEEKEG